MPTYADHADIRIGTLVSGNGKDPARYIEQILPHGFESFSITFWQTLGGVDLKKLAREVQAVLKGTGAIVSSLGVFGNPLENGDKDKETQQGWRACVEHAEAFGCDVVAGFTGRVRGKSIPDSIGAFTGFFGPLARDAKARGVRLAFENCPMGGDWHRGDWNIAHCPAAWKLMFEAVDADNVGLEWEPCHQMCQLIDPIPQLREWTPRIFHLHGKDATVLHDVVRRDGIGGAAPFVFHRHPGFGDSDWTLVISELRRHGFRGAIDIEGWHDPVYRDELEMTGQVHALEHLKRCRGGRFVANPSV